MTRSIFIVGTDTDIGKTFVSGGIMHTLNKYNKNSCYFKPVQSGVSNDDKNNISDVDFVKAVSSINQNVKTMNTYSFEKPLSPHLAAEIENINIDKNKIIEQYEELKKEYDYMVIEGAGGVIVPLIQNYYIYDLIRDMNSKVIVVAGSCVGTINHTCLTIDFLKRQGIIVSGIIINRYTGEFYEDDNIRIIEHISKVNVKAVVNRLNELKLPRKEYDKSLDIDTVLSLF